MRHDLKKFRRHVEAYGLKSALRTTYRRVVHGPLPQPGLASPVPALRNDIIGFYESILGHDHGSVDDLAGVARNTLQWVIPDFGFGSGGHLNIFRFINMLADLGYEQRLVILPPYHWPDANAASAALAKWYFPLKAEVALGVQGFRPAHVTLATGWQTAYWVSKFKGTREHFYFVQDFEPYFHAISSEYFLAENTYRLGMKGITAGTWLRDALSRDYGMPCGAVSFGCDANRYYPRPRRDSPNFNLLFYSRHVTRRRLFELGLVALARLCERHPEVAVIFAGGDVGHVNIPFHHLNAGELTLDELPDLYSQCDLSLVLSGTNLSLLPLELAACKCPVVMNDSPSARWLLPESAAYYAPLDPEGMADVLSQAVTDGQGRAARVEAAYQIAQAATWEKQRDQFVHLLEALGG